MDLLKAGQLSRLFKSYDSETNRYKPVILSTGQQEIFNCILERKPKRIHIMTPTQYGKSFTVALAVLVRAVTLPEKWAIVAPSEPKAMIIMRYVIEQATSNELFSPQLDVNDSIERLRRERSKRRINFKRGGEIFVLSADSRNKLQAGESLMGFGSPNIVLDESCLIDDDIYAKIKRMLGGHKDNFLLEIGNPWNRNHFLRSFRNEDYHKVVITWQQAVKEGRLTQKFIDEMRKEAFFNVLYDVEFPPEDSVDAEGWSRLITEDDINRSFREQKPDSFGSPRLGVDLAGSGGSFTVWVKRTGNYAEVLAKTTNKNTMETIGTTVSIAEDHGIPDYHVYIDATGLGAPIRDRFAEIGWNVNGCNMSERASYEDKYINRRAEMYFRLRDWVKKGGMLQKNNDFYQLGDLKYKLRSNGKLKIISKEELLKDGIPSPDVADALMLTFGDVEEELTAYQAEFQSRVRGRAVVNYA